MQYGNIGVFDSGVGGLTVLRAITDALPDDNMVYFGDTARMPYGDRPPEDIVGFAREIISFLIGRGARAVAVACNTSSALAVPVIADEFDVPVIGMIECGANAAVDASRSGRIGVIATANTVRSGAYGRAICRLSPEARVFGQACPLLVPMVERGEVSGPEVRRVLVEYLSPLLDADVDTIVYGCTHYPFLDAEVRAIVGSSVALVDPAVYVAEAVKRTANDCRDAALRPAPSLHFITSGDPGRFSELVHSLLGWDIGAVEHVDMSLCSSKAQERAT